jgi:hypothetical protein
MMEGRNHIITYNNTSNCRKKLMRVDIWGWSDIHASMVNHSYQRPFFFLEEVRSTILIIYLSSLSLCLSLSLSSLLPFGTQNLEDRSIPQPNPNPFGEMEEKVLVYNFTKPYLFLIEFVRLCLVLEYL